MFDQCKTIKTFSLIAPELETCVSILCCSEAAGAVTTVHLDAPKMKTCSRGFQNCTSLTSFTGDLSSLLYGNYMFYGCKLDGQSVATIYNSIPTITLPKGTNNYDNMGVLTLGINSTYSSTASTNTNRLNTFGVAAGFTDWASLKQAFVDKGWDVQWYYAASDRLIEV